MTNRRTLTLVVMLALAGALVFPSAAAPLFDGDTDRIGDGVELAPGSEYAYMTDDELVVDLSASNPDVDGEGVNPDGVTTLGDVFYIRYNGTRSASVWLTHEADGVTFSVGGTPIESASNDVTLGPNESVPVSVTVDTTAPSTDGFVGDITIHSRTRTPTTETRTDDTDPAVNRVQSVVDGDGSREFTAISTISGGTATFDAYGLELDAVADQNLTFDGLTVGTTGGPLVLSAAAVGPEAKHALAIEGVEPLGAVELRVESGRLADATLRFSVSERYFERRDVDPANLTVYRKSDGELSELPLRVTGKRDGRVTFEAETPGFSTFVVGVDEAGRTTRTAATGTPVTTDSGERQSTPDTEPSTATEPATPAPVEEPGGFGLSSLVGLLGLLAIIAAVFALARRVPRG